MNQPDSAEQQQREQDELEATHDFWSISASFMYRDHVQERQNACATGKLVSYPTQIYLFDVVRRTRTTLDVLQEGQIDDYRNVDGDWIPSGHWTGITQFTRLSMTPPRGYTWSGED